MTISEHVILFVLFLVFPPVLTYFAQPDLFLTCLILFPAIYVVMHIGIHFQERKGEEIDVKWKEVADRFQLRFDSESSSDSPEPYCGDTRNQIGRRGFLRLSREEYAPPS